MPRSKYIVWDNWSIRVAMFPLGYQFVHTNTYMPVRAYTHTQTRTHMDTPIYACMCIYVNGHTHIYTPPCAPKECKWIDSDCWIWLWLFLLKRWWFSFEMTNNNQNRLDFFKETLHNSEWIYLYFYVATICLHKKNSLPLLNFSNCFIFLNSNTDMLISSSNWTERTKWNMNKRFFDSLNVQIWFIHVFY